MRSFGCFIEEQENGVFLEGGGGFGFLSSKSCMLGRCCIGG